jgi:hypothetical protein
MSIGALSGEDIKKLKHTIEEAVKVKQEVKDLNEGMKDVVKHVADELNIPVGDLNKAIGIAFKKRENSKVLDEEKDKLDEIQAILDLVGF